jgi:type II secretory pathway pseudopilin PulG
MPYCTNCGQELPEGAAYCTVCDHPTPATLASRTPSKSGGSKMVWLLAGAGCVIFAVFFVGVIAAILVPNFLDALEKAKQKRTVADLRVVSTALLSYQVDHNGLPEGRTYAEMVDELAPEYLSDPPEIDGWKRPFRYECWTESEEPRAEAGTAPCEDFRLASPGRDGVFEHDSLVDYEGGAFPITDYDRDLVFGSYGPVQYPGSAKRRR